MPSPHKRDLVYHPFTHFLTSHTSVNYAHSLARSLFLLIWIYHLDLPRHREQLNPANHPTKVEVRPMDAAFSADIGKFCSEVLKIRSQSFILLERDLPSRKKRFDPVRGESSIA
jgi:hypothetical protein